MSSGAGPRSVRLLNAGTPVAVSIHAFAHRLAHTNAKVTISVRLKRFMPLPREVSENPSQKRADQPACIKCFIDQQPYKTRCARQRRLGLSAAVRSVSADRALESKRARIFTNRPRSS